MVWRSPEVRAVSGQFGVAKLVHRLNRRRRITKLNGIRSHFGSSNQCQYGGLRATRMPPSAASSSESKRTSNHDVVAKGPVLVDGVVFNRIRRCPLCLLTNADPNPIKKGPRSDCVYNMWAGGTSASPQVHAMKYTQECFRPRSRSATGHAGIGESTVCLAIESRLHVSMFVVGPPSCLEHSSAHFGARGRVDSTGFARTSWRSAGSSTRPRAIPMFF